MTLPTRPVSHSAPLRDAADPPGPAALLDETATPARQPDEAAPSALAPAPAPDDRTTPAAAPTPVPPGQPVYGWFFLLGLAVIIAVIDPIVIAFQPHLEVSLGLLLAGGALLGLGWLRHRRGARVAGAALLWIEIALGIGTQISPLTLPPGLIWGPRGLLLAVAGIGWGLFLGPPPWLRRGLLAAAGPTLALFGLLWLTSPPIPLNAGIYWMATDSHGTLYGTDVDRGVIWVFDGNGNVQGKLWPRRGTPGRPGPGILPEAQGTNLGLPGALASPTPGGFSEQEFLFCGLAVDPQDHLYVADPELFQMRQFDPGGQLHASWKLPESFIPARGCLAADQDHVYLGDNHGLIYVYDHIGTLQAQWNQEDLQIGLGSVGNGQLLVLRQTNVAVIQYPQGNVLTQWNLPEPSGDLKIPYQAVFGLPGGATLVSDVGTSQVRRYGANHQPLPSLGVPGAWPGQFNGVAGVTADAQGHLYVSDFMTRVIQRFGPDGHVDAVWLAPEGANGE